MNLLAIDTSTELATVALAAQGELYYDEQAGVRQHAQVLLPMIERLLISADLTLSQLDAIVFGRGPGSFTGLRVACSIAKGLAYAHDLPVYPVSSLAAIASDVNQGEQPANVLAMLDARMNQVYWAYFDGNRSDPVEQVSTVSDIVLSSETPVILAGVGFESYLPHLSESIQARIVRQQHIFPNARAMIRLVQQGQVAPVSAADATPIYVRNQVTQGEPRG